MDFNAWIEVTDEAASLVSAYAPVCSEGFRLTMEKCATPEIEFGDLWQDDAQNRNVTGIGNQPFMNGKTCEDQLKDLWLNFLRERDNSHPKRIDDLHGEVMPTISARAVGTGELFDIWKLAEAQYLVQWR